MNIKFESEEIETRGLILTSETPDEAQMLLSLWVNRGHIAGFERLQDKNYSLTIAPKAEEKDAS